MKQFGDKKVKSASVVDIAVGRERKATRRGALPMDEYTRRLHALAEAFIEHRKGRGDRPKKRF